MLYEVITGSGVAASTEACSTAVTSTRVRPQRKSAWALASEAPLVKTTSAGLARASAATASRASSTIFRAARPK